MLHMHAGREALNQSISHKSVSTGLYLGPLTTHSLSERFWSCWCSVQMSGTDTITDWLTEVSVTISKFVAVIHTTHHFGNSIRDKLWDIFPVIRSCLSARYFALVSTEDSPFVSSVFTSFSTHSCVCKPLNITCFHCHLEVKMEAELARGICHFDTLLRKSVPHILENIFFSLDYTGLKQKKWS